MKRIVYLLIMVLAVSGCAHHPKKLKSTPDKPYEATEDFNFNSTPKEDANMFQKLGLDYFKQKDWPGARNSLSKAVKLDPKLYWSWYCLGLLNIGSPEGYNYLKKSAEVKPDFPGPYYWMAYYHCRAGEDRKAIPLFKKYIGLAKGKPGEEERLKAAKEALRELSSGKEGEALAIIRKP